MIPNELLRLSHAGATAWQWLLCGPTVAALPVSSGWWSFISSSTPLKQCASFININRIWIYYATRLHLVTQRRFFHSGSGTLLEERGSHLRLRSFIYSTCGGRKCAYMTWYGGEPQKTRPFEKRPFAFLFTAV